MADFRALIPNAIGSQMEGVRLLEALLISAAFASPYSRSLTMSSRARAPWLWLQQVTTAIFAWGVFIGMAAATRRNDHFYLTEITKRMTGAPRTVIEITNRVIVLIVAMLIVWCGWQNALLDLGSFRMPSLIPLTVYTAIVPAAGVLIILFTIEQLVNGWKNGFEGPEDRDETREALL
jgi:TRAP-type C4-dicarboxylate transport system permease small subunit